MVVDGGPNSGSASATVTLTTIPRASSITATDANIESATTININRASSSFTHTITYSFSGTSGTALTGTIATKTSNTSVGWTVPSSFYAKIPNSKTGTVTLTCTTYNGNTSLGSKTTTFIATASEARCKPTLTATLIDSNSTTVNLTGDNTKLVKFKSTARITPTATALNSATISSIKVNGSTVSGSYKDFANTEQTSFTVVATDSRGYTTTVTKTPSSVINYVLLKSTATFKRTTQTSSEIKVTYSGNYFNGNFSTNTANTLTVTWKYREKNASSWTNGGTLTPTKSGNTYSGQAILGNNFNYQKSYDFILYISDRLMSANFQDNVKKGEPIYDYGVDSNGHNYLYVNGDFYIKSNNKVLWSGNDAPQGQSYTLTDNIYNYRFVIVVGQWGNKIIIPIIANDTYFHGGMNYPLAAGTAMVTTGITGEITDNGAKVSITYFRQLTHTPSSNHGTFENPNLLQIIGIK